MTADRRIYAFDSRTTIQEFAETIAPRGCHYLVRFGPNASRSAIVFDGSVQDEVATLPVTKHWSRRKRIRSAEFLPNPNPKRIRK